MHAIRRLNIRCQALFVFAWVAALLAAGCSTPPAVEGESELANTVNRVAGGTGSSLERAERLVNWMYEDFEWTENDYASRTVEEILERRAGHCGEMAWVLEALLEKAGIGVRVVKEVNIHPRSKRRQASAEKLVSKHGETYSVFGYMHNDHRWLEVYDDVSDSWLPADPTLGVFGLPQWIEARLGFGNRPKAAADMLVPIVVLAENRAGDLDDRSEHYLIVEFNAFYGGDLERLEAWSRWEEGIRRLREPVRAAFAGELNLHGHSALIEEAERAYLDLTQQYERRSDRTE